MDKTLLQLFKVRDKAVKAKDKKLFLSVQLGEISNSSSESYFSNVDQMETKIIGETDEEKGLSKKIVVRETYYKKDKENWHNLVIYSLVQTSKGWRIYNSVY